MFNTQTGLLFAIIVAIAIWYTMSSTKESWGASPGTLMQISSNSGYYPNYRYGYGYKYPYYMYRYPYHMYYPMGYYPRRYQNYNYGIY